MVFGTALDGTFLVQCMIFGYNGGHKIVGLVFTFGWEWMGFWIFHTVISIMAEHISFCPWPNKPKYRKELKSENNFDFDHINSYVLSNIGSTTRYFRPLHGTQII